VAAAKKKKQQYADGRTVISTNRRALRDYEILDRLEVGLVLHGTEVKSLRDGKVNLGDAYARLDRGELWLMGCNIAPYINGTYSNHDPERRRKLLAHRRELLRLQGKVREKGLTLIPLSLYFRDGRAKLELALARGKRQHGRKEEVAERDRRRQLRAARRNRNADI